MIILAVDLGVLLAALDSTIVGTAMPTVIASLGGLDIYSWVFSAYLLTYTISMPIFGKLSDLYGRKGFYLLGIGIFLLGSALCGLSRSMEQLIAFRALQGIGGGGLFAIALTIFGDIFPPVERGRMQGYLSAVWGFSSLVGPLSGGFIVDHLGWRWVFYVNLPIGLLATTMIIVGYHEPVVERGRPSIDYLGAATLSAGIASLLFGTLLVGRGHAWSSQEVLSFVAASAFLLLLFLYVEAHTSEPLLPLAIFKNRTFSVTSICSFLAGMGMFGAVTFLPLFVQGVIGGSATNAGVVLTPMSLGWVTGSTGGGRLVNRLGYRQLGVTGMGLMTAGFFLLSRQGSQSALGSVIIDGLIIGLGMGFITITIITAVQNRTEAAHRGIATSSVLFFRMIGATVGVAVLGTVLSSQLESNLRVTANPGPGVQGAPVTMVRSIDPRILLTPIGRSTLAPEALALMREGLARSLRLVFLLGFGIAAAGALASAFLPPSTPLKDSTERPSRA